MTSLLVVDDEAHVVSALRRMLLNPAAPPALREPHLTTFTSPVEALEYVASHHLDLVISDYRMPVMDGVSFLTRVKELQPDAARIILSAYADMEGIVRAINEAGIFRFISKPCSDPELKAIVAQVLAHRELLVANPRLADEKRVHRGVLSPRPEAFARLEHE